MLVARSRFVLGPPWILLLCVLLHTAASRAEPEATSASQAPQDPATQDPATQQPATEEPVARPEGDAAPAAPLADEPRAKATDAAGEGAVAEPPSAAPALPGAPRESAPLPAPARAPKPLGEPTARATEEKKVDEKAELSPSAPNLPNAESFLSIELDGGVTRRLDRTPTLSRERKFGGVYTLGLWGDLGERVAVGLELQHAELGGGSLKRGLTFIDHDYAVETAWLSGRFIPIRGAAALGFLALRAGLAVQRAVASGVRQAGAPLEPARGFRCSELDGPGLALGGGIGARFGLGPGFAFITRLDGAVYRLSSESIEGCAAGAGSSTSATASVGLAYGL